MEQKRCSNCFKEKPLAEFYRRNWSDGYQSRCKICNNEVVRAYMLRKKEKMREKYAPYELENEK